jgi:hypothetical protein
MSAKLPGKEAVSIRRPNPVTQEVILRSQLPDLTNKYQGGAAVRRRWPGVSAAAQPPKARAAHAGPHAEPVR